ncbi:MAG TPA: thioredoxin domain-containing protein [Allosphingosinicella sp.]|jgi:protein-disulfide isomerase
MRPFYALAAAALLGSAGSQAAAPPRKAAAPAARDWSRTVVATPEGGFRVGNPAAPVKLVEYGSLTCNHCAAFAREGVPPLMAGPVKSGRVSYEFRNFVLNGIDVTATLLARCAGPDRFFALSDTLYRTQEQWVARIAGLPQAQKDRLEALPDSQRLGRVAELGGLLAVAARFGVTPARGKQCLADKAALDRLGKINEAGMALGVKGTPTFLINGQLAPAGNWATLEPLLKTAG